MENQILHPLEINKGHRRADGFIFPQLFHYHVDDTIYMESSFMFTQASLYMSPNKGCEQQVNKLMGVSIGANPFRRKDKLISPPHHFNSIRFGWRCDYKKREIIFYDYRYTFGGVPQIEPIISIPIYIKVTVSIKITPDLITFNITPYGFVNNGIIYTNLEESFSVEKKVPNYIRIVSTQNTYWCYPLGLYFGGKEKAPQKIEIMKSPTIIDIRRINSI